MKLHPNIEWKVGVFVGVGLLLLATTILVLGGNRFFLQQSYELKARFKQVQGLSAGSVVSLSGINIGNVKEITFDPESSDLVAILKVQWSSRARITQSSVASIKTQGALGDKYLYLTPGKPDEKPLNENEEVQTLSEGDWLDTISSKTTDLGKMFEIISEFHKFSKSLNADGRSEKIFAHLLSASEKMDSTFTEIEQVAKRLNQKKSDSPLWNSLEILDHILTKVDKGQGTLGALINDPVIHERLKELLGDSRRNKQMKTLLRDAIK